MTINNPKDIPGLRVWYSADYEATQYSNGAAVTTLHDLSGNSYDATPPGGYTGLLINYTGGPGGGAYFAGAATRGWQVPSGAFSGLTMATAVITAKDGGGTTYGLWDFQSAASLSHFAYANTVYDAFGSTSRRTDTIGATVSGTWYRYRVLSKSASWKAWKNGTNTFTDGSNTVNFGSNRLLANSGSSYYLAGMGLFVLYDHDLTSGEAADPNAWWAANQSGGLPFVPPGVPQNVTVDPSDVTAFTEWDAPISGDPADGYNVRLDGGSTTDVGTDEDYTLTSLTEHTTYDSPGFEVQAYNAYGESAWVAVPFQTEFTPLETTYYEVTVDGGDPIMVEDLCEVIDGLEPGGTYVVCVRACNDTCCSEYACIEVGTCPAAPTGLTTTVTRTSISLCWDENPLYTYEVSINGSDPVEATSCYEFPDLSPETNYTVSVRACNATCCGEYTDLSVTTAQDVAWAACPCNALLGIETCDLATGKVRGVLLPVAVDIQTIGNQISTGTLTFPIKGVRLRDIWPGLTSIYLTYDGQPIGAFLTSKPHAQGGTVQVGIESIESYLTRRMIRNDLTYTATQQTVIGASLVAQAIPDGIPLYGDFLPSVINRDRSYLGADRPFIWPTLEALMQSENGPDYTLLHTKTGGYWSTRMLFEDEAGRDSGIILLGDVHLTDYSLDVDAVDLTNLADGIGASGLIATSDQTATSPYPRFDAAPQFTEVTDLTTLQEQTDGYVQIRSQPYAVPGATIVGDWPPPNDLGLHDTATFRFSNGAATFDGPAKITGITWRLTEGSPLMRALTLEPIGSVIETVLNAAPTEICRDC